MSAGNGAVLEYVPAHTDWDFGGFPYGLEPLRIPMPTVADGELGPMDARPRNEYELACDRIRAAAPCGRAAWEVRDVDAVNALYWFRWITGHQVSFVLWRLIAQALAAVSAGERPSAAMVDGITPYVRGYCAMLLYTSSCPRDVYHRLIRPSMYLQHRAFSGSWAPDYRPVRPLFRGRRSAWTSGPDGQSLAGAVDLYQRVHTGIAVRLVPEGRSLLQESPRRGQQDMSMLGMLYDSYFMTLRAPVPRDEVVTQLVRRLVAVTQDVAVNGLYPEEGDRNGAQRPDELCSPAVLDCEDGFAEIAFDVASAAAARVTEAVPAPLGLVPAGEPG